LSRPDSAVSGIVRDEWQAVGLADGTIPFAILMGLRGQADYNWFFVMDAEGFADELARVEALFSVLGGFLDAHGIVTPSG
jgi:hypothetical protein